MALHPGVLATKSGWIERDEVVELVFDPRVTSYEVLLERALREECATALFPRNADQRRVARRLAPSRIRQVAEPTVREQESKYYLSQTPLRAVPLTGAQAARINALVDRPEEARKLLSPAQRAFADLLATRPPAELTTAIGVDLLTAWKRLKVPAPTPK